MHTFILKKIYTLIFVLCLGYYSKKQLTKVKIRTMADVSLDPRYAWSYSHDMSLGFYSLAGVILEYCAEISLPTSFP